MNRRRLRDRNAVLHVLADGNRWHGYDIHRASGVRAGRVYVILAELEAEDLVRTGWDEWLAPSRRFYQLRKVAR